jgi:hypothetical protein
MTSWASRMMCRLPKAIVQVERGGISTSSHAKVPPKATTFFFQVQTLITKFPQTWGLSSILGLQIPHEGSNEVISSQIHIHWEGLAKTNRCALQGSTSHKNHAKLATSNTRTTQPCVSKPPFQIKQIL